KINQELGDKSGMASSMAQLGRIAELERDYVTAVQMWQQAYSIFEDLRSPNKDIVAGWFARLREELGETEFEKVWQKAVESVS
ncbi:MAG TPA: hypothetical protein HA349_05840, partial [Methanotrichaceae archaeon]|nr:hypothetical protein [Methanotrichaceae archaeon]